MLLEALVALDKEVVGKAREEEMKKIRSTWVANILERLIVE